MDLRTAAQKLGSPLKAERDAAEAALLAARDGAVPFLIEALEAPRSPGPSPVARASLLVSALGARDAVPALLTLVERGALAEDGPFVARALADLLDGRDAFDDRARAALERLSLDPDRYTRAFAAQAFGSLGDLRSKARVQALAQDPDAWVREKATAVLQKLQETEALARADVQPSDFAALVAAATAEGGALKPYLDDLGDPRRAVRDAAVAELVRAGRQAVPFLLEKLNQPQVRARIGAAVALGRLQATDAAGPLLVAATTAAPVRPEETSGEEGELRAVALRSLASCLTGLEEGLAPSLLPLARDRDRFVRAAALLCLGRLADRAGMRAVVEAIVEDDPFVVESAAVALSEGVREEDSALVRPLLRALEPGGGGRPKPAVKEAIFIALSRVAIDDAALRVHVRHRVRRDVHAATSSARKAVVVLLEQLYAPDDPPPLSVVEDVFARLEDDHPEVRVVAASFLRTHLEPGHAGSARRLQKAIGRGELTLSLLGLEALARQRTVEARAALEAARDATGADNAVREHAASLLTTFVEDGREWTFEPKPLPEVAVGRAESQRPAPAAGPSSGRPSRVRPVTTVPATSPGSADGAVPGEGPGEASQGTEGAVEARFDAGSSS
jgi:HEAT repeat protein